ncbi:MAG: non-homologous end-joining DNA ligase, partial [Bdellovibrionales bacterium]|nr:non-homologous end-joining DNA ligase [Bdellovibrionales bacterium]
LTNLEKIYFPEDGYTKGDVIEYYRKMSSWILPYLKDRPESLNRHPNGIGEKGFYQKDMTGHVPRWFKTTRIFSESTEKSIDYPLVQDERSLLYVANLGCIEIHPWFSKLPELDHPTFLVIDLDPDGNDFDHVIEIAHEFHKVLDEIGAVSFCKTSGATGIHIGVPTGALHDFDTVRAFAERVCKVVAKKFPATTSLDRNPHRRQKKIYLDYMQNRRGQTLAAPYCIRPRQGAPVSMPLEWKELKKGLRPSQFHIENVPQFLTKRKSDPWAGVLGKPIDLKKCSDALKKKFGV